MQHPLRLRDLFLASCPTYTEYLMKIKFVYAFSRYIVNRQADGPKQSTNKDENITFAVRRRLWRKALLHDIKLRDKLI